jgi:hypothetical protein
MAQDHDKPTIISMAVIASASATLLHEGVGHGITAWLRGDIVTELTSNHLSTARPDKWVDAAGTLVNLGVGAFALLVSASSHNRAAARYFFWLLAALNLLPGAGYFLFSGVFGFGDWDQIIKGSPHYLSWRIAMVVFGLLFYIFVVRILARFVTPFVPSRHDYNTAGRLPYLAACIFSCLAGGFDPLGIKLLLVSTIPAAFGGSSGLLWADSFIHFPHQNPPLDVPRLPAWWAAALLIGVGYTFILGRGIQFQH